MTTSDLEKSPDSTRKEIRRVVASSYLGNLIEIYDFVLYGSAAALVLGPLFFGNLSPAMATVASFGTLATGFIARPVGGILFGYLGDRVGRKPVLIATLTLMGLASGCIGVLPTQAQIGVAAPIVLVVLRLLQGIAAGGEWGGSVLMIAEHSDRRRRGLLSAVGQAGMPSGSIVASLAMVAVTQLPKDQLLSWGWRIPFLASFLLLVISLYVRRKVAESPLFVESGPARDRRAALVTLVTAQRGALFRGFLISIPIPLVGTLCGSFAISYAVQAGHSQSAVLLAFGVGLAVSIALMPLYGWLSDRLGRKPVYVAAALAFAVAVYPFFWALSTRSVVLLYLAFIVVLAVIAVAMQGALAAFLSELFPLRTRSTGVSVAYQAGGLIAGLAPVAAASLIAAGSGRTYVALLGVVFAVIAAYAAWRTPELRGADLAAQQSKTFSRAGEYAGAPATEER